MRTFPLSPATHGSRGTGDFYISPEVYFQKTFTDSACSRWPSRKANHGEERATRSVFSIATAFAFEGDQEDQEEASHDGFPVGAHEKAVCVATGIPLTDPAFKDDSEPESKWNHWGGDGVVAAAACPDLRICPVKVKSKLNHCGEAVTDREQHGSGECVPRDQHGSGERVPNREQHGSGEPGPQEPSTDRDRIAGLLLRPPAMYFPRGKPETESAVGGTN